MTGEFPKAAGLVSTLLKTRDRLNERIQASESESDDATRGGRFKKRPGPQVPQDPRPGDPGYVKPASRQNGGHWNQPFSHTGSSPPNPQPYDPPYPSGLSSQAPRSLNGYGYGYGGGQAPAPTYQQPPQEYWGYSHPNHSPPGSSSSHDQQRAMQATPPLGPSRSQSEYYPESDPFDSSQAQAQRSYTDPNSWRSTYGGSSGGASNYGTPNSDSSGYGASNYGGYRGPPYGG